MSAFLVAISYLPVSSQFWLLFIVQIIIRYKSDLRFISVACGDDIFRLFGILFVERRWIVQIHMSITSNEQQRIFFIYLQEPLYLFLFPIFLSYELFKNIHILRFIVPIVVYLMNFSPFPKKICGSKGANLFNRFLYLCSAQYLFHFLIFIFHVYAIPLKLPKIQTNTNIFKVKRALIKFPEVDIFCIV